MDDIRELGAPNESELVEEKHVETQEAFRAFFNDLKELPTEEFFNDISQEDYTVIIDGMRSDYAIKAALETLKSKMWKPKWFIATGDEKNARSVEAAELIRKQFTRQSGVFYEEIKKIDLCLDWGKAVNQIIYEKPELNNGLWFVKRIKNEDQDLFTFDYDGNMRERLEQLMIDEPFKWVVSTHDEELDNENGKSILIPAYWAWHFRNILLREGVNYFKRAVIPAIIAHYKASENAGENATKGAAIAKTLKNLRNSTGVAMANVEDITTLNIAAKGDELRSFIDMFDMNIALAITGSKRLFNVENGSRSSDETQDILIQERAQNIMKSEIIPAVNRLIAYITKLNFQELEFGLYPTLDQRWGEVKADADQIIDMMALGVDMDRDMLIQDYGFPIATDKTDNVVSKEDVDPQQFSNSNSFFFNRRKRNYND